MQSYDVLKVLSDQDSLELFNEVSSRGSIDGKSLLSLNGLSKKQYYSRVKRLAECGLIRRRTGRYSLTSFGKVIYDCKLKIDKASGEYYSLKAVDSFNDTKDINKEQKEELIQAIVQDSSIKAILIS